MAPTSSRGTNRSGGRLGLSHTQGETAVLDIATPTPSEIFIEDGDTIMRLPPHISLIRRDPQGSCSSNIKHFIDPKKWPELQYESDSLFIPEGGDVPPSEAALTAASWSPQDIHRLAPGESISYIDVNGNPRSLSPTDASEFVEIVPPSIAIFRPDPRVASQSETDGKAGSFVHLYPLYGDNPEVSFDGPQDYPFSKSIASGKPRTWKNRKLQEPEETIDFSKLIDAPSVRSMADVPLDAVTETPTRRGSTVAATRAAAAPYRAVTRSSTHRGSEDPRK